jgi:hypothetical protein
MHIIVPLFVPFGVVVQAIRPHYLAVYYLKGQHTNTHIHTSLLHSMPRIAWHPPCITCLPKAGGKLLLIDQPLGVAQGQY